MHPKAVNRPARAVRNPDRTRERILAAALHEFSARGFAGARVDAIARRAGSNKRMLYHYFTGKAGLFRAVLRHKIAQRTHKIYSLVPEDLAASLPLWFAQNGQDTEWLRLLTWESLQTGGRLLDERERHKQVRLAVARVRREQAHGTLDKNFEPALLLLAVTALSMFPHALPHLTRLITGLPPSDPKFQRGYSALLKKMAGSFLPRK